MDLISLSEWFTSKKRLLPWRQTNDPYAIWVSEIMLQQTQVAVVIPYFHRWMERFPTIEHLSLARLDDVLKTWEGLGYYSRARNLHAAAQYLTEQCNGKLPNNEIDLKKIKGLGPYTIGALLSFAFHQKKEAVDGNVIRVLTRYFGLKEDVSKQSTVKQIQKIAFQLLPENEPWVINEALIELGATVCQKKPHCNVCPLQEHCQSYLRCETETIPFNSKKIKIETLYRAVAVIQCESLFLVKRGAKGELMSDLYEFPYFSILKGEFQPENFQKEITKTYALQITKKALLKIESQSFTRFQAKLFPMWFNCAAPVPVEGYEWLSKQALNQLPFSSGHRRIFQQILSGHLSLPT